MIKYFFDDSKQDGRIQKNNDFIDILFMHRTGNFPLEHTHDFYEIIILKKNALINVLDGIKTHVTAPFVALNYPQNVHSVEYLKEDGVPEFYNITINKAFFEQICFLIDSNYKGKLTRNSHYFPCEMNLYNSVLKILDKALALPISAVKEQQLLLKNAIIRLLTEYFTIPDSQAQNDTITLILSEMSTPKNMTMKFYEIANLIGYCPEHIIRLFAKKNLPTPNTMFQQIKLDYSCTLLVSTNYNIPNIAEAIGIKDISYFNKLFKKHYGISPTAYRKKYSSPM